MDSSFQCVYSYYKVKNGQKPSLMRPVKVSTHKKAFTGKVYVFTNGGSYSCSAIVANTIKKNKRRTNSCAQTGGSLVNSGAPNNVVILPNTNFHSTKKNIIRYKTLEQSRLRCATKHPQLT